MSNAGLVRRVDRLEEEQNGGNPLRRWSDARLDARLLELAPRALRDPTVADMHERLKLAIAEIQGRTSDGRCN